MTQNQRSMNFKNLIKELQDNLNKVTLKELCESPELQKELAEINVMINDFFRLLNPKVKALILKDDTKQ